MTSADRRLAEHASEVSYDMLSSSAVVCAKKFLLDTIGVGVAGSSDRQSGALASVARQWAQGQEVGIWGSRQTLTAPQAILVNAYQVHCQEYDSIHENAVLHAMATIAPTLLTKVALTPGISGKALIAAIAAGTDVSCRIGLASEHGLKFFRPATSGGFGAVAALSNLLGLAPDEILCAFGHQLAQASGTMQGHTEGTPTLPLQIGFNARASWQSCDLARAGIPSVHQPLTGRFGYLPMFEKDYDIDATLPGLGEQWSIEQISHKPFPSGRASHGGVEGLMALQAAHGFDADAVRSVTVHGPSLINHLVNRPPVERPSENYARLCMPFVLAKVLQHGHIDLTHYRGEALHDPRTYELSQKVKMVQDDNPDPNAFCPQVVVVELHDGKVFEHRLDTVLACPERPLSREQYLKKFRRCWELSAVELPPPDQIIEMIDGLETLQDCQALVALLGPQA